MTLLEAISARHSVRKYLDKEIPADIIAALQDKIAECNKIGNLNIQLVQNETKAFTGMLSYGSFSGVKNYLVMVGKKAKDLGERVPSPKAPWSSDVCSSDLTRSSRSLDFFPTITR